MKKIAYFWIVLLLTTSCNGKIASTIISIVLSRSAEGYFGNQHEEANKYIKSGMDKLDKNDSTALMDFNNAVLVDSNYYMAYLGRAKAKIEFQNYDGVLKDCERALKYNNNSSEAYYFRGLAKTELEDSTAIYDLDSAIKLKPDLGSAYNLRAEIKMEHNNFAGAIRDFDKALSIDNGDIAAYKMRGDTKFKINDFTGAIQDYNSAIALYPNGIMLYINRSYIERKVKDYPNAISDLLKALELDKLKNTVGQEIINATLISYQVEYKNFQDSIKKISIIKN